MMKLRAAEARGKANSGWLDARHSFPSGHYYDPEWMGHSALRVINQDLVAPGGGFATHPHANMEILTCVLQGTIEHKDSLGHAEQIPAGDFQLMGPASGTASTTPRRPSRSPCCKSGSSRTNTARPRLSAEED
jgi:redox-sensitive bicupin YhaK (pirin superfamily)